MLGGQNGQGGPLNGLTNMLGGGAQNGAQGQGPLGGLTNMLGGQNGQQGGNPIGGLTNMLGRDGASNLLNGLLGSPQQQMQMQQQQGPGGLADLLRRLPQRGIEMLQSVLTNVRNMLPGGLGRNSTIMNRNPMNGQLMNNMPNMQNLPNMQNPSSNPLGQLSSNLNGLTAPVNNLMNGQLPDVNQMTNQLSQTASQIGSSLTRTLSGNGNSNSLANAMPVAQQRSN